MNKGPLDHKEAAKLLGATLVGKVSGPEEGLALYRERKHCPIMCRMLDEANAKIAELERGREFSHPKDVPSPVGVMSISSDVLEQQQCACGDGDCDNSLIFIHGRCHPSAPVQAYYTKGTGVVSVICAECEALIVHLKMCDGHLGS